MKLITELGLLISISSSLAQASADSSVPSLTSIRDSLSILEDSIVHSLLSLSSISKSSPLPALDRLQPIFNLTHNQTFNSQAQSQSPDFISKTHPALPPYLVYSRGNGSQFGDDSTHNRTESVDNLIQYFEEELFDTNSSSSSNSSDVLLPNAGNLLLLESTSFLSLLSSRIHLGISVAQSKFDTNQTFLCRLIRKDDRVGIRKSITVEEQETLVKDRVESKASAWSTLPNIGGDYDKPTLNSTAKPGFDYTKARKLFESYLIPITSDVEVATLLKYKNQCG